MQGDIWVDSTPGEGSSFGISLTLPVAAPEDVADPVLPKSGGHALIVEPQATSRDILERQLAALGLTVATCASGVEALTLAHPDIDIVLCDHNMAQMDGLELAEALREAGHTMPIVLLSQNTGYADQDPARAHVQAVLQKPAPRRALIDTLAAVLPPGDKTPEAARTMRVLAAEDNKTNRLVFSKMLSGLDIELQFAENGREAVDLFHSFHPDVIFMDISMPEMDGKEATRIIRQVEGTGTHVPIVAMTAHAMQGDEADILAAGLDHYLTKPLRKADIIAQIIAACPPDARAPQTENAQAQAG